MERKAATPRGIARYLKPAGAQAAQDSPARKRPPEVDCAVKY